MGVVLNHSDCCVRSPVMNNSMCGHWPSILADFIPWLVSAIIICCNSHYPTENHSPVHSFITTFSLTSCLFETIQRIPLSTPIMIFLIIFFISLQTVLDLSDMLWCAQCPKTTDQKRKSHHHKVKMVLIIVSIK